MSDPSDTFLREVQQEYRRDRAAQLFSKYGTLVLGGAFLIVAAVGGYVWYSAYTKSEAEKAGGRFTAAQRLLQSEAAEDKETALKDFREIAQGGTPGYATLARLQLAGQLLQDGNVDGARTEFEAVRANTGADPKLRSFADLQLATLDAEQLDFDALKARLGELTSDQSLWRYSARELLAIKAVEAKQNDDARQLLADLLAANEAPASIRRRAEMMLSLITVRETPVTPAAPSTLPAVPAETQAPETPAQQPAAQEPPAASGETGETTDTKKPETSGN